MLLGLIIKTQPTVAFLIFALGLGLLFSLGQRHGGLTGTFVFAVAAVAGTALTPGSIALLLAAPSSSLLWWLERTNSPALTPYGYLAPSRPGLAGSLFPFILLLAAAWITQFVYLRATFRTLTEDLRRGAEPPADAVPGAAGARLAIVEGRADGDRSSGRIGAARPG